MSSYYISASVKLKSTRKVDYQCENCGGEFSYLYTVYSSAEKEDTVSYHEKNAKTQELKEIVFKKAMIDLNNTISVMTDGESYGYENCPGCGYTQSWMKDTKKADERVNKMFTPMIVISVIFGVGSLIILINDQNVLLLCVSSFILWAITIGLIFWLNIRQMIKGKEPKDTNEKFGTVERKNTPTVVWSNPEITN